MKNLFTKAERATWSDKEIETWKLPDEQTVTEWANKNFYLDHKTSAEPGRYKSGRTPYIEHVLNAFTDPDVSNITMVFGTQTAKTEAIKIMVGHLVDQDPGPTMVVYPDKETAKAVSRKRFQSMFRLSPTLRKYIPKKDDDFSQLHYDLESCFIKFAWSGSDMQLAQDPIRYLFMDEVPKYRKSAGKKASAVKLAEDRTKTFPFNKKIVKAGTPEFDYDELWTSLLGSDHCQYWLPCPECGEYQLLKYEQLSFPDDVPAQEIEDENLAVYHCCNDKCDHIITDAEKIQMLAKGVWAPLGATVNKEGSLENAKWSKSRGYWLNSFYSPWVTFSQFAKERVECGEDLGKLQSFINGWVAEPWVVSIENVTEYQLDSCKRNYEPGICPNEVLALTAGIDRMKYDWYYVIRGWGHFMSNWLIRANVVPSWDAVKREVLDTFYMTQDQQKKLGVRMAGIDAGYKPDESYAFCKMNTGRTRPFIGVDHLRGELFKSSKIDRPQTGRKKSKLAQLLWRIDVEIFKDILAAMINPDNEQNPLQIYVNISERYMKQMQSERKELIRVKKGKNYYGWVQRGENHFWDCEVYALAAAYMMNMQYMQPEGQTIKSLGTEYQKPTRPESQSKRKRGPWLKDHKSTWRNRR